MNKAKKFINQAFSANSLLHGLLLAVLTAIGTEITPFVNSGTLPNSAQLLVMGKAALVVAVAYLLKNGAFGSSQTSASQTSASVDPVPSKTL